MFKLYVFLYRQTLSVGVCVFLFFFVTYPNDGVISLASGVGKLKLLLCIFFSWLVEHVKTLVEPMSSKTIFDLQFLPVHLTVESVILSAVDCLTGLSSVRLL